MERKWLDNYEHQENYIINNQNNDIIPIAQDGRNLKRLLNENIKTDSNINLNFTKKQNVNPTREIKKQTQKIENVQKKNNVSRKKALEIIQKEEFDKNVSRNPKGVGEISIPEDQSIASKTWEVLTNPVTAASYWLNDQRIPDRFSKGERNNLDIATDLFNPFGIINSGKNAVKETISLPKNLYDGEYSEAGSNFLNAGLNTLAVIPALRELKGVKPTNIKNTLSNVEKYITTKTPLKNAYKVNPWAFKPNPEAYYRGIGKEGVDDILESKIIRSKKQHAYPEPYFSKGVIGDKYAKGYFAELTNEPMKGVGSFKTGDLIQTPINTVSINNPNLTLYKKDWLRGYKPIEIPESKIYNNFSNSNFKSEINWGNWNKEIPDNPQLMQEYNAIEQTSKANGTWMKNPDGSMYLGPRERWIQEQSINFKKAYPDGFEVTSRGIYSNKLDGEQIAKNYPKGRGIFGGDPLTAHNYSKNGKPMTNMQDTDGVYQLYYPKTKEAITIDAKGRSWREVPTEGLKGVPNEKTDLANVTRADTDDIATWLELNNKPSVKIKNVFDGVDAKYVDIINHKPGNYLKSMFGNNGMFDMTNPNIYKTLVPGAIGLGVLQQKKNGGVIKDNDGYWNPDNWGKVVEIDSNDITMKGVSQPLLGISDEGDVQYMEPNKDYKFKGKKVTEFPIAQKGKNIKYSDLPYNENDIKNFYDKMLTSDWYKQRLIDNGYGISNSSLSTPYAFMSKLFTSNDDMNKEINNVIDARRKTIKKVPVTLNKDYSTSYTNITDWNQQDININPDEINELRVHPRSALVHEIGHAETDGAIENNKQISGIEEDIFKANKIKYKTDQGRYVQTPKEAKGDINSIRYNLYKAGKFDVKTGKYKTKDGKFDKTMITPIKDDTLLKRMLDAYGEEGLTELMNKIAQNNNQDFIPIARNGINNLDENSLQQLDQLTNFTNYNKLSNGGWLDKF